MNTENLISPRQLSEVLQVKESTLANWRCKKSIDLPYVVIGGLVRYRTADVDSYIQRQIRA